MKTLLIIISILFYTSSMYSQDIASNVMNTTGGHAVISNWVIDYSVGETFVSTITAGSDIFTEGLLQPELRTLVAVEEPVLENAIISVFPNPTMDFVNIKSDNLPIRRIEIWNSMEKRVFEAEGAAYSADMSLYSRGVYYLHVFMQNSEKRIVIKVVKI